MVFAGLVALGVLAGSVLPVYSFWPWLELPGWGLLNIALLALGTPALILLGIGWFLRQDAQRADRQLRARAVGASASSPSSP